MANLKARVEKEKMSNECFVDTVCWIALLNKDDELHELADNEYKCLLKSGFHLITTTAVLNETANALCKPPFRKSVIEFYQKLQKSSLVEIVFVDKELWSAGWQLYEQRSDKQWSLTDCISIIVMQERNITNISQYYLKQQNIVVK
jgi:predicted nucleic acid-binding protein